VKKKLIDFENPFFKPMWIRVLVVAFLRLGVFLNSERENLLGPLYS